MSNKDQRDALCQKLKIDELTLVKALLHSSFANEKNLPSNEARALLGDSVLRTVLVERMMAAGVAKKGDITIEIAKLASNTNCAAVARSIGLEPVLLVSAGFQIRPFPDSLLATAVEALIGGLYLDAGWDVARDFVLQHWPSETSQPSSSFDF